MNKDKIFSFLKELLPYIIIIIAVLLVKAFVFTTIRVNGPSMESTLHDGDIMILNRIGYRFQKIERFDIVVIQTKNDKLIKRVIGLPGEHIAYRDNTLYINGKKVEGDPTKKVTADFDLKEFALEVIPEDSYFVLGDNRVDSVDSRMLGVISKKDILGHAVFTVFPLDRFGATK